MQPIDERYDKLVKLGVAEYLEALLKESDNVENMGDQQAVCF